MVLALASVLSMAASAVAQAPKSEVSSPVIVVPAGGGELWNVTVVQEFYGLRDREPAKRDRQQQMICYARGAVGVNSAADAQLPADLKDKCWLSDKRTEPSRQQTKYACNDGMSAEVATRKEADGSFGSQVVVNIPEKGGISITRTMRRVPGACDPAYKGPPLPVPPRPPGLPGRVEPPMAPIAPIEPDVPPSVAPSR